MSPAEARALRVAAVAAGHARGWSFTPLAGKKPTRTAWQLADHEDLETALAWAEKGNVGLRTGTTSGVFVVDVDEARGGVVPEVLRDVVTPTVRTGGRGLHLYCHAPELPLGNSAGRLDSHVDTRGLYGQAVFVGSVHPTTGLVYDWLPGLSPADVALAPLPTAILQALERPAPPRPESVRPQTLVLPAACGGTSYGHGALRRESKSVADSPCGERNVRLNSAAFSLGRLVASGHLAEADVVEWLVSAARGNGYFEEEGEAAVRAVITSGMNAGIAAGPRGPSLPWTNRRLVR